MKTIHRRLTSGLLAALAVAAAAGAAQASGEIYGVGPEAGLPYTSFLGMDTHGQLNLIGAVGYDVGGGFFQPLTTPITSITAGNGGIYAVGTQPGSTNTSFYVMNNTGRIQLTGGVGFDVPGGVQPLTNPITAIAYGGGDTIYGVGPVTGTPYTDVYQMNQFGRIQVYGPMGYDVGGGFIQPLTTPVTGLAYDNGELYAIGGQEGSPYTAFYRMSVATLDKINLTGTVVTDIGGGFVTPYSKPLDGLADGPNGLFAIGPDPGNGETDFLNLEFDGHIAGNDVVRQFDGVTAYPDGVTSITYVDLGGTTGGGVPEPAAWALMVLGFGALGSALRTRRGGAFA